MRRVWLLWRFQALTFQRGQTVWCFVLPDSQRALATNTPKQMRVRRAGGVKEARRKKGIKMVSAGTVAALGVKHASKRSSGFEMFARRASYASSALIVMAGLYGGSESIQALNL